MLTVMENTDQDANLTPTQRVWKRRRQRWAAFKAASRQAESIANYLSGKGVREFFVNVRPVSDSEISEIRRQAKVMTQSRAAEENTIAERAFVTVSRDKCWIKFGAVFPNKVTRWFARRADAQAAVDAWNRPAESWNYHRLSEMSRNPNTRRNSSRV